MNSANALPENPAALPVAISVPTLRDWLTPGRFALFLALAIAALYSNVLFGDETFYYRDYGPFGYALAMYHRDCFWNGHLPTWNSLSSCGLPYLAQWNTLTLYPLSLIYLLLPLPWSLSFFCLAHLFLAGLGMYFLAFCWTKDRLAAAVAGVAYAFSGLTLHCLMWPNNIAGLAWMPWVVMLVQRGWREGGRLLFLGAVVGAVQMLSGAPEVIVFTWFIAGVLLLTELLNRDVPRSAAIWRSGLMLALVIGVAAVQLLPFLDLVRHSHRDTEFGSLSWAMPLWGWINLVLPIFRASPSPTGVYYQPAQSWTSSYYPGIAAVFLALWAFRLGPRKQVWPLWSIAIIGLVMALGEQGFVYAWIYKTVPFLGFMRFPIKFVVLPVFVLPLLAAYAVAGYRADDAVAPENKSSSRWALIIAGGIVVLIVGAVAFSYWHPFRQLRWIDLLQNGLVRIFCLGLVLGILAELKSNRRFQLPLQIAVIFCLVFDGWTHMPNQNPTVPSSLYESGLIARQLDSKCASGQARALLSKPIYDLLLFRMVADHTQDHLGRRAGLFGNFNLLDGVPTVDGFYSLYLLEQRQIWSRLFFRQGTNFPNGLADFVGVLQVTTNLFEWQTRPSTLPLLTAGMRPEFGDRKQILDRLIEPDFDPRKIVYLPSEARTSLSATNGSSAQVRNTTYQSGHISADVEATQPSLVVVAESYYDGWQASVDGKPAKIWRANHAFQAVEVPAGHRHIELRYREKHFAYGAIVSGSSLLLCLIGWLRARRKALKQLTGQ